MSTDRIEQVSRLLRVAEPIIARSVLPVACTGCSNGNFVATTWKADAYFRLMEERRTVQAEVTKNNSSQQQQSELQVLNADWFAH